MPVDSKDIIEKYKRLHIDELLKLAAAPGDLREDVIPLLQQELVARGRTSEAESLGQSLAYAQNPSIQTDGDEQPLPQYYETTDVWLQKTKTRFENGLPLEHIYAEAKDRGKDAIALLKKEEWYVEASLANINELREHGLSDEEIDQKLNGSFSTADITVMRKKYLRNGIIALLLGFFFVARGLMRYETAQKWSEGEWAKLSAFIYLGLGGALIVVSIVALSKSSRK
jgi:hypothetical protein